MLLYYSSLEKYTPLCIDHITCDSNTRFSQLETIIQHDHDQDHNGKLHIFPRGQTCDFLQTLGTHVHNEGRAVMLYKPFSTCILRACTRSCVGSRMDRHQRCYIYESNTDTYESPKLQELEPQPSCWFTGFWMTWKDRARGEHMSKNENE